MPNGPIVGFSNLIKRDFFKRDGPKREPMILRQNGSEKDFNSLELNYTSQRRQRKQQLLKQPQVIMGNNGLDRNKENSSTQKIQLSSTQFVSGVPYEHNHQEVNKNGRRSSINEPPGRGAA